MSSLKIVKLLDNPVTLSFTGGINAKGEYVGATAYVTGDSVSYLGSSYVAVQATTGNLPSDTTYWQLLAEKGEQGIQGEIGPQGPSGDPGPSIHSGLTLDDGTNPHGTTKADVGLSNVDNTSDLDKPISTATQTALDLKAEQSEILAARAAAPSLNARISNISNFASPNAFNYISGQYYDNSFHAGSTSTKFLNTNRMYLSPFFVSGNVIIDQLGVSVSTAGAATLHMAIYESNASNHPTTKIWTSESLTPLDCTTTGGKFFALSPNFTFQAGKYYWIAIHSSGSATVRAANANSSVNLGLINLSGASFYTILQKVIPFVDGMPDPIGFFVSDRVVGTVPSTRMRIA